MTSRSGDSRIASVEFLPDQFPQEPGRRLVDYLAAIRYRREMAGEVIA
ncbi:MAG: hypothetical protein AB7I59_29205 [Geminicoccaceae bacterium]